MYWGLVEVVVHDDDKWDAMERTQQEAAVVECRTNGPFAVRAGKTLVAELGWKVDG